MARAQADEVYDRVHHPQPRPDLDVAALVKAELAAERRRVDEERRRTEDLKFAGGPCWACGVPWAAQVDTDDPTPRPDWHTHRRGQECGACRELRNTDTDETFIDLIAATLAAHGVDAIASPNWKRFRIEPGAAERWGVKFWIDSGEPAGERFDHLRPVAERIEAERQRRMAEPSVGWDAAILAMAGAPPSLTYGRNEAQWARLSSAKHTVTDAEAERRERQQRQRIEASGRRR